MKDEMTNENRIKGPVPDHFLLVELNLSLSFICVLMDYHTALWRPDPIRSYESVGLPQGNYTSTGYGVNESPPLYSMFKAL